MRPGTARQRWKTVAAGEATSFSVAAICVALFVGGPGKWFLFGFLVFCAWLAVRDYHRGWKVSYKLPPHGKRQIERGGLGGEIARKAWEDTQRDAARANRKRYAFQKDANLR